MTKEIREALASDEAGWRRLWREHFAFHQVELPEAVTDSTWNRILDPQSTVSMRVGFVDGEMLGYAIYFAHPSSWVMADDGYLEDLYVSDRARGLGLGRALMDDLVSLGRRRGWSYLYWHVREGNLRARMLYDQYAKADDSVRYRMKLDAS